MPFRSRFGQRASLEYASPGWLGLGLLVIGPEFMRQVHKGKMPG
jgi:hypothetical protein